MDTKDIRLENSDGAISLVKLLGSPIKDIMLFVDSHPWRDELMILHASSILLEDGREIKLWDTHWDSSPLIEAETLPEQGELRQMFIDIEGYDPFDIDGEDEDEEE